MPASAPIARHGARRRPALTLGSVLLLLLGGCGHTRQAQRTSPALGGLQPTASHGGGATRFDEEACVRKLWEAGVRFERLHPSQARGVGAPLRLTGPVGGVQVRPRNGSPVHAILDCRLGLALLRWSPCSDRRG